jgi:hypothetical protein
LKSFHCLLVVRHHQGVGVFPAADLPGDGVSPQRILVRNVRVASFFAAEVPGNQIRVVNPHEHAASAEPFLRFLRHRPDQWVAFLDEAMPNVRDLLHRLLLLGAGRSLRIG